MAADFPSCASPRGRRLTCMASSVSPTATRSTLRIPGNSRARRSRGHHFGNVCARVDFGRTRRDGHREGIPLHNRAQPVLAGAAEEVATRRAGPPGTSFFAARSSPWVWSLHGARTGLLDRLLSSCAGASALLHPNRDGVAGDVAGTTWSMGTCAAQAERNESILYFYCVIKNKSVV